MGAVVSLSHIGSSPPSSSLSAPSPAWGPSHRRQSSMNCSSVGPSHGLQFFMSCSSMGPSHRVQSFRNRLLQCGSLPQGHKPCQQTCSSVSSSLRGATGPGRSLLQRSAPHGVTASFRHPPAPSWGLPWATGGDLLPRGPPWAAGGQPAWSTPWAGAESLLQHLKHFFPLLLHRPWCLQSCCSCILSLLSPAAVAAVQQLFPFLKYFITEVLPPSLMGSAWPVADPYLSQLELPLLDIGEDSSSHRKPPR